MAISSEKTDKNSFIGYFEWFVHSEVTGSILLLACTVFALVWANSPWAGVYDDLLHTYIGVGWGDSVFKLSLHHWINDGLMVIFFFVVGLEIKRELVVGELSSFEKASLPVAAAVGGMVVPALFFVFFNFGGDAARGLGHPDGHRHRLRPRRAGHLRQESAFGPQGLSHGARHRRRSRRGGGDRPVLHRADQRVGSCCCSGLLWRSSFLSSA